MLLVILIDLKIITSGQPEAFVIFEDLAQNSSSLANSLLTKGPQILTTTVTKKRINRTKKQMSDGITLKSIKKTKTEKS